MGVGSLHRNWITYPDDPDFGFAALRAWDRHLLLMGLLPIGTSDLTKVGPILVDPNGSREYITYGFTESGHLTSWRQALLPSRV